MTRDEAGMLPRWLDYYGNALGVGNLVVIDDNSVDGSTSDLPCSVFRMPPGPYQAEWTKVRKELVNGIARGLLSCYDVVIFSDVDEFLVPDPAHHAGLLDYLKARQDRPVLAPLAVNVLHNPHVEAELDPQAPVLSQRRFVKFAPGMCKPLVKRTPAAWSAGFHGIRHPFQIDRELLMLHLKFFDVSSLGTVSEKRRAAHYDEGRGNAASTWTLGPDELKSRLLSWVATPQDEAVPEFDPNEPDVSKVVRRDGEYVRSRGSQLKSMESSPLRQLPARFRDAL
jgi:glycosyl transferase family 2